MIKKYRFFIVLVLIFIAGFSYWYWTPYGVVKTIKEAFYTKNDVVLSQYIDFNSVRQSLKADVSEAIELKLSKIDDKQGWKKLGISLIQGLSNRLIDDAVTPVGIKKMMEGEDTLQKLSDALMLDRNRSNTKKQNLDSVATEQGSTQSKEKTQKKDRKYTLSLGYLNNLNHFEIKALSKKDPNQSFSVEMTRVGLFDWKITRINMNHF